MYMYSTLYSIRPIVVIMMMMMIMFYIPTFMGINVLIIILV